MTIESRQLLQDYEQYLLNEAKGEKTVASYLCDTKAFLLWLESKQVAIDGRLTRFFVTSFKTYISDKYKINTFNKKINSLHNFNHFLVEQNLSDSIVVFPNKDKIKVASGSEHQVEVFTEQEVEQLLFHLENRKQISQRDRLMVLLLLYTGVRVGELVSIKIGEIDLLSMNLKVIGKGGKYREVPIKLELAAAIKEYLEGDRRKHKHVESDFLLLTQRSGKMDKDTVNKMLNRLGEQQHMTMKPHKYRHTFCTRLLNKGAELTTVAKLAGHANIQTTAQFYINTSQEEKQKAVALL